MKTKHISPKRKAYIALMRTLMAIAAILTGALVLFLIVYVLAKGIPNISWELLSTSPSYLSAKIGILPDILNTIIKKGGFIVLNASYISPVVLSYM